LTGCSFPLLFFRSFTSILSRFLLAIKGNAPTQEKTNSYC
jgi:hypothetical protein